MNDYQRVKEYALKYNEAGLNVVPCKYKSKIPALPQWKQFINRTQSAKCVSQLFEGRERNVGIMGGVVSNNLTILDFDDHKSYDDLINKSSAFKNLTEKTWVVRTPKGKHVYLRTNKPIKSTKHQNIDIKSSGGYCLAPTSMHPGGQLYMFSNQNIKPILHVDYQDIPIPLEPETRTEYLNILQPIDDLKEIILNRRPLYGLSWISRDILCNNTLHKYKTRSEALQRVIVEMVGNGYSKEHIHCLFQRYAAPDSRYRESGSSWLDLSIKNAIVYVNQHQNEVSKDARMILANIDTMPIEGRRKHSKRAVISAIAEIIQHTGKTDLYLGQRELAERSGLSLVTVNHTLKELPLKITVEAGGNTPTRYLLDDFVKNFKHTNTSNCFDSMLKELYSFSNDSFRMYGLNKTGAVVVGWINRHIKQDFRSRSILKDVDLSLPTICKILDKLVYADVLKKQGYTYHCVQLIGENELKRVADVLGTTGALAKQQKKHAIERKEYKKTFRVWQKKAS
jgi:DNA-binding transcriptional regulator YhcF (GntR family)